MKPFNRERFLFYLLGAVLAVNALFFGFGLITCRISKDPVKLCPDIGTRFDNYSEKALAAVLGLIAGAGAITFGQRRASSSDDRDASASPLPQQPQQLSLKEISPKPEEPPARGRGQTSESGRRKS